jgi:hypothetical protein
MRAFPPLRGRSGAWSGPSLGEVVDQETFVFSGVKGAAPLGQPPPLGEWGVTIITTTYGFRTTLN